jgi:hypothetical protein
MATAQSPPNNLLALTSNAGKKPAPLWLSFGRNASSFPALLVALLTAKVFYVCRDRIADPDLWWHLRNAQFFLTNHKFPDVDTFSFAAAGSPWINHEWLPEIFYYAVYNALGLAGVFLLCASVLSLILTVVFLLSFREAKDPFAAAIAVFCGSVLAAVGFGPRTQSFGWLCLLGVYAIMLRFRATKSGPLWLVPMLFALWINCHGSWIIGLTIYSIFIGAGLIKRDIGRLAAAPWSADELKRLIATGIASIAALFLNPFGYHLALYPFDMIFRQKLNIGHVEEWASVNFNDANGTLVAAALAAIFAIAIVGRKQWRIDDALLTAFVLYCGLSHMRFLLLAAIVLPPIISPHLGKISSYDPRHERRLLNSILLAVIAGGCILAFPSAKKLSEEQAKYFPIRAIEFLRANPQQGNIFNGYEWGGYLEWRLPKIPTFIDSRTDIFEHNGTLKDYLNVTGLVNSDELLAKHQILYVLYPSGTPLAYFLSRNVHWKQIYSDDHAVIYRRVQDLQP